MGVERFAVTTNVYVDASDPDEAALLVERHMAGAFDSEVVHIASHGSHCGRSAADVALRLVGDDEEAAHDVRLALERRFHWSLAYADEAELRYRFASFHGYDEAEAVPDELWAKVWPALRETDFWLDAEWVDDFVGDRIDWWLAAEEQRAFDERLRDEVAAWEDV
ncbi:MAG: hypothetical protein M3285_01055 [Actinomycetota bacterium]|nr:hypothetical protein [Actinomycetota bacterium]MDQ3954124.1 hypothetical protein [Actinomycetota bacterium]